MPRGKHRHGGQGRGSKQQERVTRAALRRERKSGAYLNPGDPDFKSFANRLAVQGLALKDVPGDGNCLFRALTDQLRDGHTNHRILRRDVVAYMRENSNEFAPFLEEDITFDEYLSELAEDGEYAGNDAIVAFSRRYSMHVVIHQLNAPRWEVRAPLSALNPRTLHIAYLNGEHYCSIQPLLHAESAGATPLLPQLSSGGGKGEEETHTPGQRPTRTSKKKKRREPTSPSTSTSSCSSSSTAVPGPSHQEEHEAATCSGVALGSTSSSHRPTSLSAAAERVASSTGCKDMALVEDCLRENNYESELAIVEVLQVMSLAQDTSTALHLPATLTTAPSPAGSPALDDEKPSSDGLPSPNQAPSSHSPQKHISSGKPPPAASQATERSQKPGKAHNLHHQHHHLSNRERKELAKAARKQRRDQERKENRTKPSREGDRDTADPVGATAI